MERENLFSVNLDKKDVIIDREEFIIRRESAVVAKERRQLNEESGRAVLGFADVARMLLGALLYISLCFSIYLLPDFLIDYFKTKEVSTEAVLPVAAALAAVILCFVLKKVLGSKKKNGFDAVSEKYGKLNEMSERDLSIPADAKTVEIFKNFYDAKGLFLGAYINDDVKVFKEGGNLCLGEVGAVIAVPLDSIEAVVKVNDKITFSDWTKAEPYDSGEYASYGIVKNIVDGYRENFSMNGYYSIRFSRDGEPFEILVPLFEMKHFSEILNMPVTQE